MHAPCSSAHRPLRHFCARHSRRPSPLVLGHTWQKKGYGTRIEAAQQSAEKTTFRVKDMGRALGTTHDELNSAAEKMITENQMAIEEVENPILLLSKE